MIPPSTREAFDGGLYRGLGTLMSLIFIFSEHSGISTDEFEFLPAPELCPRLVSIKLDPSSSGLDPPVKLQGENSESVEFRKLAFEKLSSNLEPRAAPVCFCLDDAEDEVCLKSLRGISRARFPAEGGMVNSFRLIHSRPFLL